MFEIITIDELLKRLDGYVHKELHVHHTWSPSKANFNGSNGIALQEGMKTYHLSLGWADIGQHVTLLPDGKFVTGRPFGQTPASISGYNEGGFAMEMLGNFDIGHDVFEGAQKASALRLAKYFIDKGRYIRFHRENSPKTCPGTSINKDQFMAEAKGISIVNNVVVAAPTSQAQYKYCVVMADKLNVRSGIGTGFPIISQLVRGDVTEIYETRNGWYRVACEKGEGWVSGAYVAATADYIYEKVTASTLNVRDGGSDKCRVIGQLKKDQWVKVGHKWNGWAKIDFGSTGGYVSGLYIK